MDLLDDSGDETNAGRVVAEVDENILLNSDDEEGSPMKAHCNHVGLDEEELLYEGDDDEFLGDDPEDVLNLELGEDELETPDSTLGHVAVKLRQGYEESHGNYETGMVVDEHENSVVEDETGVTSTEDHVVSESPSSSRLKPTADSDDDEDSPRQRTRFLTERKTEDIPKHSGPSEGNPITTLGERNQRPVHGSPNSGRGNRGGFSNRGKHFGQRGGQGMQNMRQRPPSLLGDRPRPLLRFPGFNQPRMHPNDHMHHQLQGGFIDFNKPIIRPINKSPMKKIQVPQVAPGLNVNEQEKSAGVNQNTNLPNQAPTNITVMNKTVHNPGAVIVKRALGPRPMMNRPMRPPRPVVNRPNPFLIMDPNLQGHQRGPRMHQRPPMHQHLHNPGFRQQWNQQPMGPRGIPVVIPGGNSMMPQGPCLEPEPFNNFNNGPQGILGPPPPNGPSFSDMPPNGFRQPYLPPNQPRFPPEEMIHQHLQPQHQVFMQQNFPMAEPLQQQQQPFMLPPVDMDFQRHRAPSSQMHSNQHFNQMPPQPLRQNEFRFQGQLPPEQGGWPMQQQQHPEMHFQPQHQQQQQPQQHLPKLSANSRSNFGHKPMDDDHRNRPNPFYPSRQDQNDNYNNGSYEDHRDRPDFTERHRTNYDSKSNYESVSSSDYRDKDYHDKDYHDKDSYDYDRRRDYEYDDYEHESRSSQYRPPLKRPSEFREEYRTEKRGYGSPEKRLDGRLGPPVTKNKEVYEDTKRQEEAIKVTRESQKVMGVDNEYLRRIEEQKEMRERILREKEHRRKKQQGGGNSPEENFLEENTESRREVRIVKPSLSTQSAPKPRAEVRIQATSSSDGAKVANKSIYINPRAFRGDLSAFKHSGTDLDAGSRALSQSRSTAPTTTSTVESSAPAPTVTSKPTGGVVAKKRTILRIVRNKKGEIISKSKVVVLPKGSLVGGSTTTIQHASK